MSLDKLIEEHFTRKSSPSFSLNSLIEAVDTELEKLMLTEQEETAPGVDVESGKKFVLSLPRFSPTENWGAPESLERGQVNQIFRAIGGGASLPGKLAFIKRLQEPDNRIRSPRRIISTLIVLESLSATINSFGAPSAGFVFEGFLAALLGGVQEAEVSAKGNLPIQDIIAFTEFRGSAAVPMSLKLLKETTVVKGSYTNLVDALAEFEEMVYVVVYKTGGDREVSEINLNQFIFTRENFLPAITINSGGQKLVLLPGKTFDESYAAITNPALSWEEKYALLTHTAGYTAESQELPGAEVNTEEIPEDEEEVVAVTAEALRRRWDAQVITEGPDDAKTQWALSTHQLQKRLNDVLFWEPLGLLEISPEKIYGTASSYLEILGASVVDLFEAVAALSQNLNVYFVSKDRGKGIAGGEQAVKNARVIEKEAAGQLEKEGEK
tara:strand:- start:1567 stop:2883 length:1317 start_codon:yes stop_codon:yes gene_type:complete